MPAVLVTAPVEEPVTVPEAKEHLRLETSADDNLVLARLTAARQTIERRLGEFLVTQTWDVYLDEFPADGVIRLPVGPVASITHVKYEDADGDLQTVTSTDYRLDAVSIPARLTPAYGVAWPSPASVTNAVVVRVVVGYGTANAVPEDLKAAILMLLGHWYENREAVVTGTIATQVPESVEAILNTRRVFLP